MAKIALFAPLLVARSALAEPTNAASGATASAQDALEPATPTPAPSASERAPPAQATVAENATATPLPGRALTPPSEPTAPDDGTRPKARKPVWYGWQTLTSDVASFGIVLSQSNGRGAALGLVGYLTVPPVIHFAHREYEEGISSFALRALAPAAGALVGFAGAALACQGDLECARLPTAVGAGVGVATAVVLDATVLAVKRPPRQHDVRLRWRPIVMTGKNDARIGIAGTF